MRFHLRFSCAALLAALVCSAASAAAQVPRDTTLQDSGTATPPIPYEEAPVRQYDLSGPRLGASILADGTVRTLFGWHYENTAAARSRGPWLVVERVLLFNGIEQRQFLPSGTLVFGIRLPNGFEFGVGPSLSLGGQEGWNTAVVIAAGRTFHFDGVHIPVNLALATNQYGQRFSVVTGWAIRDRPDDWHHHR
jgi:hypothetical protein